MSVFLWEVDIDSSDKMLFEDFCDSVGMNISTAINMFIKNVIKKQELPFKIENDPFYSIANQKKLKKAHADYKKGRNWHYHDLIEA